MGQLILQTKALHTKYQVLHNESPAVQLLFLETFRVQIQVHFNAFSFDVHQN